jgi:hypothetical protein
MRPEWEERLRVFRARCEAMRGHSHAKTHALAVEFLNDWEAVFAILDHPFWPLTNNEAVRALRHWVILRPIFSAILQLAHIVIAVIQTDSPITSIGEWLAIKGIHSLYCLC